MLCDLVIAAKKTAQLLDEALKGVARTGMILEGYGVDHLHAKLFPMHGTGEDDKELAELAAHIRSFAE